jgi:glycosyltransferase involved in cell wall biosynthesis
MRISYINGICARFDAISNSIRDEIAWLSSIPGNEVCLFTYSCDFPELPFKIVCEAKDVIFDSFFQRSDVVIFHFGVFYPLFNILPVVPRPALTLVVFHNITPKEFLSISAHETIDNSFKQMNNIVFADHVICVSTINQELLSLNGIDVPSTVLPLALRNKIELPSSKPSFVDGVTRILFVGRLVKSKGPVDLLTAVLALLAKRDEIFLEVDFVSNIKFSDPDIIKTINILSKDLMKKFGKRLVINLYGDAPESVKNNLFARADLFVLPTQHEGFCVPILEAFQNGCCVVAYDNSNVPHISGGFAKLVPTRDVNSLTREVADILDLIRSEQWHKQGGYETYCTDLAVYCKKFSPELVGNTFVKFVHSLFLRSNLHNR